MTNVFNHIGDDRLEHVLEVIMDLAAGDLDARAVPTESDEELEVVTSALNMLADRLQANTERLEQRVRERTAELDASNAALRREVREHEAARRSLQFTQFAVDHAADAIFWLDPALHFTYVNDSMCRATGYDREDLLGRPVTLVDTDFACSEPQRVLAHLRTVSRTSRESHHRRRDGSAFPVECTTNYFEYAGSAYICVIARDVSERHQAEIALLVRDANLKALAENANDGIVVIQDDRFAFVNRRFAELLGDSVDHLTTLDPWSLLEPERLRLRRGPAAERPAADRYETTLQRRDGGAVPVEITAATTTWDGSAATLAVLRDITAHHRTEAQLRENAAALAQRTTHLQQVNDELQHFLYLTSHDLKAPLRSISQLTTVLEEELGERLDDAAARLLELLRGRVRRMHGLLESLLGYAVAGRSGSVEEVDTARLLQDLIDTYPVPAAFTVELAEPLPVLRTTALHLRQVFANLLANAIEHHDRGDGHVRVSASDLGDAWEFTVRDDGPGIPAAFGDKVFGLFQTLAPRDKAEHAGMGLALARKLVERAGGRLRLVPGEGRGSEFRFTWPKA